MSDWPEKLVYVLVGLAGGLMPKFIEWVKAMRAEDREDDQDAIDQYRTLLADIRRERAEVQKEFKQLREEHEECTARAAKQEEKINHLKERIDYQQRKISALEAHVLELKKA